MPTASTLLHFAFPDDYPILDVRALESLGLHGQEHRYTDRHSGSSTSRLVDKLAMRHDVSMRTLDKALWQHSKERSRATRCG